MEKVTFQEIISRMENATDYSELYDAAGLIANDSLRVDVEQLIGDCEGDGDDVSTAYSIITSDLLDSYSNEENVKEECKKVTEGVESKMESIQDIEATTFEELKEEIERLLEEEVINDDEYDIFTDIISEKEESCVSYIEERSKATNTDYEDELSIEEDYVKSTLENIIDSIKAVKGESKKVEESGSTETSLYDWLEERNFEPSIDIVDEDYDMMVAFDFTPEDADKDPFDSYMAMLAKQLKVLDDGNDILTVNMSDYVERNFDLLDAIFDISAEDREDELSQLVCDIMPDVISGYATDSVYSELLNNSKVVESKKLTEGAGAGYTVEGELRYDPEIKSFNVVSRENNIAEVDCDINGILDDVVFESYEYGDKVDEANVHISHLTLDVEYLKDDDDNDKEIDQYAIRDALDGLKISPLIGGGWSHTTFNGDLSCDDSKVDGNAYSDVYVLGVQMNLTDESLVDFIDKAVQGENIFTQYTVFNENDEAVETFDSIEDAIKYAENNNDSKVESSMFKYSFNEDIEDLFVDEVVWTKDGGLKESKKIEEKTSFDDYKDYCNDLSIDYKKSSSLNKYLNDYTNNEAKMNGISDVADKVNQLRKELKQGLKESRKVETAEKVVESQIKDEGLFDEVMSYLYGEYIKDGYDLGDDEELIDDILNYTYLASLVDLPKEEEDMETEEIVEVPAVQELLKRIREEDAKLRNVETYEGQLELSDRGILGEISNEDLYNELGADEFNNWYWGEADIALEEFASENGLDPEELTYSGRGARHILIPATYQNAVRYQELRDAFQQFQDDFVEKVNSASLDESKEIKTEDTTNDAGVKLKGTNYAAFAKELEEKLSSNGYSVKAEPVDDESIDVSPVKDNVSLGIVIYRGSKDSAYGYEENMIGIGGDGIGDAIYPKYIDGWDYELGAPKGAPEAGQEVYAMFKPLADITVDEIIKIVNESFGGNQE